MMDCVLMFVMVGLMVKAVFGNSVDVEMRILVQESLQNLTAAEDDLIEGTEAVEDTILKINNTHNLHIKVRGYCLT